MTGSTEPRPGRARTEPTSGALAGSGDTAAPGLPALVIGEALVDIIAGPDGPCRSHPGGSPANVALGLGRLGHPVRLATRVGHDHFGSLVRQHLEAGGVGLVPGSVVEAATSTATAVLDAAGAANYTFDITWALSAAVEEALRDGPPAHVHTGSIATALSPGADQVFGILHALRASATVSYDPNLRPALLRPAEQERERVEQLVALSDVVKASEEDLAWLHPGENPHRTAARWARNGPALVVLTLGANGARAWWRHGCQDIAPVPVQVVDTVGAGDAFMAGLTSRLLHAGLLGGGPGAEAATARAALHAATDTDRLPAVLGDALAVAARTAALTCAREGADPPTAAELMV
ncbi:carbohydrate kinase family protein [Streptomyces sp. NPDC003753]|uniref:carbohydrate kinase family protein n=1 Tax=Streptomyces sp. Y2F8-2 TaxID=2759675 RepID=UPI001A618C47|nr:carbohydrate kinase [Streptomyces sp. Y2F8-2]GHK04011.1 ribokinase [Streptomyces sp. Y2F8-2]